MFRKAISTVAAIGVTVSLLIAAPAFAEDPVDEPPSSPSSEVSDPAEDTGQEGENAEDAAGTDPTAASEETGAWFDEEDLVAEELGIDPEQDAPENSIQDRFVGLNTDSALFSLVSLEDLANAVPGDRIVVAPEQDDFAIQLFGDESATVDIQELAVVLPLDGALPTIEVLGAATIGSEATDEEREASATFVFMPNDGGLYQLSGAVQDDGDTEVVVNQVAEDVYRIDEVDMTAAAELPMEASGDSASIPVAGSEAPRFPPTAADAAGLRNIDLLVGFANGTGALATAKAEIVQRVAQTNQAFLTSKINSRLVLLDAVTVNYNQYNASMEEDLRRLQTGSGDSFRLFNKKRDEIGADLVALVVPKYTAKECGIAYLPGSGGAADYAFSVTAQNCFDNLTFSHELGHNLGGDHNREELGRDPLPFVFSAGYAVPGVARDLMAYECKSSLCPRKLQYSNPNVDFIGKPGVKSGVANKADVARSMNTMSPLIASYRKHVVATDVPKTHKFYKEINWLVNRDITTGFADGTYRPSETLGRSAMAAFLYRLAGKPIFTPPATTPFKDVPKTHQFYKEITWLKAKGITTGNPDGTFAPSSPVSRADMAVFIYRFAGKPTYTAPAKPKFPDVPTTQKFYKEISWLTGNSIATGYADGTYKPAVSVSREAMASFLYRYDAKFGK